MLIRVIRILDVDRCMSENTYQKLTGKNIKLSDPSGYYLNNVNSSNPNEKDIYSPNYLEPELASPRIE